MIIKMRTCYWIFFPPLYWFSSRPFFTRLSPSEFPFFFSQFKAFFASHWLHILIRTRYARTSCSVDSFARSLADTNLSPNLHGNIRLRFMYGYAINTFADSPFFLHLLPQKPIEIAAENVIKFKKKIGKYSSTVKLRKFVTLLAFPFCLCRSLWPFKCPGLLPLLLLLGMFTYGSCNAERSPEWR